MIDTFVTAILTRENGKQSKIEYKRPRKANSDAIIKICERFHIQAPDWNEYSQEFEFDNYYYNGDRCNEPLSLSLLDEQGYAIETVESD
jgi:hypothetical protein